MTEWIISGIRINGDRRIREYPDPSGYPARRLPDAPAPPWLGLTSQSVERNEPVKNGLSVAARLRVRGMILGLVAALTAVFGLVATAPASQAATSVFGVINYSSVSLGAITDWPGPTNPPYNFLIYPGGASDVLENEHPYVGGVYIGPGYCAQRWTYPNKISATSTLWSRAGADFAPGRHQLAGNYWVKIVAYKGTC
jgi:hypothetical protein